MKARQERPCRGRTLTLSRKPYHILYALCTPYTVSTFISSSALPTRVDAPEHFVILTDMGKILHTCHTWLWTALSLRYKLEFARGFGPARKAGQNAVP